MIIKKAIKSIFPSFRAAQPILEYCNALSCEISQIKERINDLDAKNEYLFWLSQRLSDETPLEAKKRIFLEMPKATGELREIQLAENYILQMIKQYADELNVQFFLMGGTALGAVRHKGFIPWDDDIDIGMFLDDYILLKNRMDQDGILLANRCYQANGGSLIKVKLSGFNNFFVDIFIFDYIKVDASRIDEYWKKSQLLTKEYSTTISAKLKDLQLLEKAYKVPVCSAELDCIANSMLHDILKRIDFGVSDDTFVCESIANGYHFRESRLYWRIDDVFPILDNEVEFENKTYSMINQYQKRLDIFFGDIWKLPNIISCHHQGEFDESLSSEIKKLKSINII